MASGTVAVTDVVVPEVFAPYVQVLTEEKSRLINSGAVARDAALDEFLAGGGLTMHAPSWKDLDNDSDNTSGDSSDGSSSPNKIGSIDEIVVRLSRNNSWSTSDLAAALAGSDPADAIAGRVSAYWQRRLQAMFIATMTGVFNDNEAAPAATEHTQNDLTYDVSGGAYVDGVTNFSAEAFVDAAVTMGDSMDSLGMVFMHSIVYARMQKNNMIDFVPDATQTINIPTFLGREVIVDDGMPVASGVYETWLFGAGALRLGMGLPKVPVEIDRSPAAGNGGGVETLYSRTEWCLHPVGHKYAGTAAKGGPTNAATSNNLAHAGSWMRVFPERKQIKIARLITREA
jgi:Major capsid protein 13-like